MIRRMFTGLHETVYQIKTGTQDAASQNNGNGACLKFSQDNETAGKQDKLYDAEVGRLKAAYICLE